VAEEAKDQWLFYCLPIVLSHFGLIVRFLC
jgi:hypothetical protein